MTDYWRCSQFEIFLWSSPYLNSIFCLSVPSILILCIINTKPNCDMFFWHFRFAKYLPTQSNNHTRVAIKRRNIT